MSFLINKIKLTYSIIKNILNYSSNKIDFLFYSENKTYQKYSISIIEVLSKKYPNNVFYVSSDYEDRIDLSGVKNFYIGRGFLMRLFFQTVKAKNFFLTLTDLDNHILKKTKNVDKYIYYFHAPVSTFKNYTETAFDNYDFIFCNGEYHLKEIRIREEIKNLKKKELIRTGYFYFDYLSEKISLNIDPNHILIAPSWNYQHTNFIDENFIKILNSLLNKKKNVIFRPHPEHFKRSRKILDDINNKFKNFSNFNFDNHSENFQSMEKAKCLITDSSGISLEYLFLTKRPVFYLNGIDKIHNKKFTDFKDLESIDKITKDQFGFNFDMKNIENLDLFIDECIQKFQSKLPLLNKFIDSNFFNFGSTKEKFDLIIDKQILNNNK
jgi:hypothetical protein